MIYFSKALRAAAGTALALTFLNTACEKTPPPFQCRDSIGCVQIAGGEPVKIGVLQALSGKVAPLGREQVRGIELAVEKRRGTILDHLISLQIEDTGCTQEGGANAAMKLIADPQMVAILGTTCSGAAAAASKAMSEAGLTMISGNNSAPFLTTVDGQRAPDWHPGYFRTAFNEQASGKTAALFAFHNLGLRKAATINDGDIYSRGLTDGFEKVFKELGGRIVLAASIDRGDPEMRPVLNAVLDADARLLFFPLFQPEGNQILRQARETPGFEQITLMSDGALIESSFIEDLRDLARGMYFVGPASPVGPAVDVLADVYETKYHAKPAASYYLNAYDAAGLLMQSLEKATVLDSDGTLHIGRQRLRDTLYATQDYAGATGMLGCNEFGDCARPVFNVLRLDNPEAGVKGLQSNVMFSFSPVK